MMLSLLQTFTAALSVPSLTLPVLASRFEKRLYCTEDAYLLAFFADQAEESPFCSSYINIPLATTTVSTTTPVTCVAHLLSAMVLC